MKALVLSAGGIRGAYQAGVVSAVMRGGFMPDIVVGTSAGALNAALLSQYIGLGHGADSGRMLADFWRSGITKPRDIVRSRYAGALLDLVRGDWRGLYSNEPLRKLVGSVLDSKVLSISPCRAVVGAANMTTGLMEYCEGGAPRFLDYAIASSAIPLALNYSEIGGSMYFDGGTVDISPMAAAIDRGGDDIVAVSCYPQKPSPGCGRGAGAQLDRYIEMSMCEILSGDIKEAALRNGIEGMAKVRVGHIQPARAVHADMLKFGKADIAVLIARGIADGETYLTNQTI